MSLPWIVTLVAAVCFCLPGVAFADSGTAISTTAMGVTGDIEFDDFSIVFANGTEMEFSDLVADSFVVGDEELPASVYAVKAPADPELENGNRLCGSGDVHYLASWAAPEIGETGFIVAVFTGDAPPQSDAEMCASYAYQ